MLKSVLMTGVIASALLGASAAQAVDVAFTINDGPTSYFYGRTHLTGSSVSGILHDLTDNGTTMLTKLEITSADPGLGLVGTIFTGAQWGGTGITLTNGVVTDASLAFNFYDAVGNGFQFRLNDQFEVPGANWLFWNGGSTPIVGTGNTAGFQGATYGDTGAVPEPASWAMMIGGLAIVGASMRRRVAKVSFA